MAMPDTVRPRCCRSRPRSPRRGCGSRAGCRAVTRVAGGRCIDRRAPSTAASIGRQPALPARPSRRPDRTARDRASSAVVLGALVLASLIGGGALGTFAAQRPGARAVAAASKSRSSNPTSRRTARRVARTADDAEPSQSRPADTGNSGPGNSNGNGKDNSGPGNNNGKGNGKGKAAERPPPVTTRRLALEVGWLPRASSSVGRASDF